jgi:hypothetical protein
MRTLPKSSAKAYSFSYQDISASTDEYYQGSAIPPRPSERLRSDGQPWVPAASRPNRQAGYGW